MRIVAVIFIGLSLAGCAARLNGRDGMDGAGVAAGVQRELRQNR